MPKFENLPNFFMIKSFVDEYFKKFAIKKYKEALNVPIFGDDVYSRMLVCRSDQKWNNRLYEMSKLPENEFKKKYSVINIWAKVRKLMHSK